MSVLTLTKGHEIFCGLLRDVLCFVLIFKDGFENLTLERKSILLVANIDTDLARISLDIQEYDSDLDAMLLPTPESVSSPEETPLPDA